VSQFSQPRRNQKSNRTI